MSTDSDIARIHFGTLDLWRNQGTVNERQRLEIIQLHRDIAALHKLIEMLIQNQVGAITQAIQEQEDALSGNSARQT